MKRAPLRFLFTILILWIGVRAAILLPGPPGTAGPIPPASARPRAAAAGAPMQIAATPDTAPIWPEAPAAEERVEIWLPQRTLTGPPQARAGPPLPASADSPRPASVAAPKAPSPVPSPLIAFARPPARPAASHWSVSAWLLVRDEGRGQTLAPGGILGGSQAGARLTYGLGGGFALSGRVYLPLRRTSGAELAAGIDWRPLPALPLNLLAERRQRLGGDGRSAFAITLYGGASRNLSPRLRVDLYGQAGIVGTRSRDLFADGALRLSRRLGPVELGAGAWGAAQPGAARLDAGPSLSWRLPLPDTNLRLQADWRFRLTGDAAPRSGPALTLSADF